MGDSVTQSELDALWATIFENGASADANVVRVGRFLPGRTPTLALAVADQWARIKGRMRYAEFLRQFADGGDTKPAKPTGDMLDDTIRRFPPDDPTHAPFFRHAFEHDELARYFNNLRDHETRMKEKERFRAVHTPDVAGYIKFLTEKDETLARFFLNATGRCRFPSATANAIPTS